MLLFRVFSGVILVAMFGSCVAFAQVVPPSVDAGRIPQRFETPPQAQALPRADGIQLPSTTPPANAAAITLTVDHFEFTGGTVYPIAELAALAAPFEHHAVKLSDVYALAATITAKYGQDGYVLTRAVVPPQTLSPKSAVVRLEIIEGFVDQVVWPQGIEQRFRDFFGSYAQNITASRPTNIKVIERNLLLASDLPGLRFSSTFKPSTTTPKAATLIVTVETKPLSGEVSIDNRGSNGRGPWQAQAAATANNLLGQHEALSLRYATAIPSTDQLSYVEASWRQVLSADGLWASFSASYNTGIPGLPPLQAINYETEGLVFNATLAYPVIRTRNENLTVSGIGFIENINSVALNTPFTDDRLRGLRARLDYDRADQYSGVNLVQGTLSQGIDGLGGTANGNPLASRASGRTDFTKLEVTVSRTQQLPTLVPGLSLYASVYAQYSWSPLLTPEQCSYGGKTFGRAFDPSALVGDNCLMSVAELRYDLTIPNNLLTQTQLYGFIDDGVVERIVTSAGTQSHQWGSAAGAGIRLRWKDLISTSIEASRGISGDIDQSWRGHGEVTVRY